MTNTSLVKRFEQALQPQLAALVARAVHTAQSDGLSLYLVGGALRDLLRADSDASASAALAAGALTEVDLALDGDAGALAAQLAAAGGAALTRHGRFGTATLTLDALSLDLARTRSESYAHPGALPTVRPAPIGEDLARRDFSVNALALTLSAPDTGALLDPMGGRADLAAGRIRILHPQSFQDDPTRLLRACRYAARIDARLDRATAAAARRDAHHLSSLTAPRFGVAWRLLLNDPAAAGALTLAARLRLTQAWLPGWRLPPRLLRCFDPWPEVEPNEYFWALCGLTITDRGLLAALPRRCALTRKERAALTAGQRLREAQATLGRRGTRVSRVVALLRPQPPAAIAAASSVWRGVAGHRAEAYADTWCRIQSPLDAEQLLALGVPRGPLLHDWLERLRDALLDGDLPADAAADAARRLIDSVPLQSTRAAPLHDGGRSKPARDGTQATRKTRRRTERDTNP